MKYAKLSTLIGCAAAILLSVPWAMPASAAPAYPLHVQCNESYRESRAHTSQGCLLNRVNFDNEDDGHVNCFVDIRCWLSWRAIYPDLPAEWVGYKGLLRLDDVKKLRVCHSRNTVELTCWPR